MTVEICCLQLTAHSYKLTVIFSYHKEKMSITRLDVSTCKDESYLFCFSMLKVSCFSKSYKAFVAWKLFKIFERLWRDCSLWVKPGSALLADFCNVLLSLVTSKQYFQWSRREFLSVREQQSHALFHQGRQAETEHDEEAADLTSKRCGLAVPEQDGWSGSGYSNQDQPAEILDKSVVIKPEIKPRSGKWRHQGGNLV